MTLIVILFAQGENSYEQLSRLRVIVSLIIPLMGLKFFEWLRLFDKTSFYIKLLLATFTDITAFIVLFVGSLYTFGMALYFIAQNDSIEENYLIQPSQKWFIWDTMINQYLLSLGDFGNELPGYENHPQSLLVWTLFLVTTFVTQITMLNMLVAIMGNTFDNVIERKSIYAIQMRLNILSDYKNVINLVNAYKGEQDYNNFVYVVYPVVDQEEIEEQADWEGGFNYLRKALSRKLDMLERAQFRNQSFISIKQERMQTDLSNQQSQLEVIEQKIDYLKSRNHTKQNMVYEVKRFLLRN